MERRVTTKDLLVWSTLAAAYFAVARFALTVDVVEPFLSAIWPAGGLALAAVLHFGGRALPGVFVGSIAYFLSVGLSGPTALAMSVCNAAEIGAAAYALERLGIDGESFHHPRDFTLFTALTGAASFAASAPAVWALERALSLPESFPMLWVTRSFAHWSAMLILTPALLIWRRHPQLSGEWRPTVEGVSLGAATAALLLFLYSGGAETSRAHAPLSFILMPLAAWPAVRMGSRETATVLTAIAAASVWGTLSGAGPFASLPREHAVTVLQGFMATLAVTAMLLSSAVQRAKDEREAASSARAELDTITDALPALVSFVDRDGRYRYVNGAYERWHGVARGDIVGRTPRQLYGQATLDQIESRLAEALAGKRLSFDAKLRYRARGERWVHVTYLPRLDTRGAVEGVVIVAFDVTAQKDIEQALRESEHRITAFSRQLERRVDQRTRRLRQVNDELEAFCYSVAHDLRSPLRKMSGFSEIVLQEYGSKLDEPGRGHLQRIFDASRRMARLIDDMLDLSKVTRGGVKDEPVDLSAMAGSIAAEICHAQDGRRLDVVIQPGLLARGDASLIETALRNLIENACKFSSTREHARIEVGMIPKEPAPIFFVRDNGVGFDMKQSGRLFTAFERLHRDDFPGNGIGLATVQRVVRRHGGRIWAEGEIGKGATFYFTLHDNA